MNENQLSLILLIQNLIQIQIYIFYYLVLIIIVYFSKSYKLRISRQNQKGSNRMINNYKVEDLIEKVSKVCTLYKASKDSHFYFMYEFIQINVCDEYNFKVIKRLVTCENVLSLIDRFQWKQKTYFVTKYAESNLLKQQFLGVQKRLGLKKSLQYFIRMIQILEQLHLNNIIYRNLRLQTIKLHQNKLYLSDFTLSKCVKRRQRCFQIVGLPNYMAPEFFYDDGMGYQLDIWAAGVCLFQMITGQHPFNLNDKNQEEMKQQIRKKCKNGFSFNAALNQIKKPNLIQLSNKSLQDLFKRILQIDYTQRITIQQLKNHPALTGSQNKVSLKKGQMSIIEQMNESIFLSALASYSFLYEFHKQQVILDFLQSSSQVLTLGLQGLIAQKVQILASFSILKVAMIKVKYFQDIIYGRNNPHFKIDLKQWNQIKKNAVFGKFKQKIQKKKKIIEMMFKAALIQVQNLGLNSDFYSNQIPQDFTTIKSQYRQNITQMYQTGKQIMRKCQSKQKSRNLCQKLVRLLILWMINRIFEDNEIKNNFQLYFKWSKKDSLQSLDQWIQCQRVSNLRTFIKTVTKNYVR